MSIKTKELKKFCTLLMWPPEGKNLRAAYVKAVAHAFNVSDRTIQNMIKNIEDDAALNDMGLYDYLKETVRQNELRAHYNVKKTELITGNVVNVWPQIDLILPMVVLTEDFNEPLDSDIVDDQKIMLDVFSFYVKFLKSPKIAAVIDYTNSIQGLMDWNKRIFIETWQMCIKDKPLPDINEIEIRKMMVMNGTTEAFITKLWYTISDISRVDVVK